MCAVSAVGDYWSKRLPEKYPNQPWEHISPPQPTNPYPGYPSLPNTTATPIIINGAPQAELDALKLQFEELKAEMVQIKKILEEVKKYDDKFGEPHCEMEEKVALLKKIAEYVGVDISKVFE